MTSKKIVLIENETEVARLASALFSAWGYNFVSLSASREIAQFRAGKAHRDAAFIISDIMMPYSGLYSKAQTVDGRLTGLRLAIDLRARFPEVPILFWSAFPIEDMRKAAKLLSTRMKLSAILEKPSGFDVLRSVIEHYFKTNRLKRSLVRRIWTAMTIRPSIYGVGVDLKEVFSGKS
jgi:CheY-like chemotaxis protein